jgi:hypothetical protein
MLPDSNDLTSLQGQSGHVRTLDQRRSAAQQHGADHDPQLVDQAHAQEARGEAGAAEHRDVLARLPLELGEALTDTVLDELGVGPGDVEEFRAGKLKRR